MLLRVSLLLTLCSGAASLLPKPLGLRAARPLRQARMPPAIAGQEDLADIVAEQAKQIAELQKKLNDMQQALFDVRRPPSAPMSRKRAGPRNTVYRLYGSLPDGFDASADVERLIARRVVARLKKNYSEADRLLKRLLRMGIKLDDRRRTWSVTPGWRKKMEELEEEDQQHRLQQEATQQELEKSIEDIFNYWDKDGNGVVDRQEFRLAMKLLGIAGTEETYDELFSEWDEDGNGTLNFNEIRGALVALQMIEPEKVETMGLVASGRWVAR